MRNTLTYRTEATLYFRDVEERKKGAAAKLPRLLNPIRFRSVRLGLFNLGRLLVVGQRHHDAVVHRTLLRLLRLGRRLRRRLVGRRLGVLAGSILRRRTLRLRSGLLVVRQRHDHSVIDLSLRLIDGRLRRGLTGGCASPNAVVRRDSGLVVFG